MIRMLWTMIHVVSRTLHALVSQIERTEINMNNVVSNIALIFHCHTNLYHYSSKNNQFIQKVLTQ
jgi:uncharacterized protein (UPF0335 family)